MSPEEKKDATKPYIPIPKSHEEIARKELARHFFAIPDRGAANAIARMMNYWKNALCLPYSVVDVNTLEDKVEVLEKQDFREKLTLRIKKCVTQEADGNFRAQTSLGSRSFIGEGETKQKAGIEACNMMSDYLNEESHLLITEGDVDLTIRKKSGIGYFSRTWGKLIPYLTTDLSILFQKGSDFAPVIDYFLKTRVLASFTGAMVVEDLRESQGNWWPEGDINLPGVNEEGARFILGALADGRLDERNEEVHSCIQRMHFSNKVPKETSEFIQSRDTREALDKAAEGQVEITKLVLSFCWGGNTLTPYYKELLERRRSKEVQVQREKTEGEPTRGSAQALKK